MEKIDQGSWLLITTNCFLETFLILSDIFMIVKLPAHTEFFSGVRFPQRIVLFFLVSLSFTAVQGQQQIEERLKQNFNAARSDSERIVRLGHLSQYYYANKNFAKGDSLIEKQIMLAEATLKQHLILLAYFGNVGYSSPGVSTKDRSKNTLVYIRRALEYAKANELTDYMALAYANLSAINNSDGQLEEAFKNANLAFTTALNTNNDSAKVISAVQLGNIYQQRSDVLMAFKTFTNAQNIAIQHPDERLLPVVYHSLASLYKKLGKNEVAKKYIHQSLAIHKREKDITGQINDNIFLAKLNNYIAGKEYLQEAVMLADSLQNVALKIEAEKILFSHMMIKEKPSLMLSYLGNNPELKNVFINTGPEYISWMLAEVYFYGGQPDSALYYFKKAEFSFSTGYDLSTRKNFFSEVADCYLALKNTPMAISYYQKSFDLSKAASDLRNLKVCSNKLKNLFEQQGDYKQAFSYSLLYDHYKDSVSLLEGERDLALLEIENVTKQQLREEELAKEKLQRKYNLQYMLITIVIATAFLLMIMIGMFKVSTFMIRLMGFLSLIFFFEFIILILDTWIHHLTHGEPWKIWLIKIGIISFLLPAHHFLEHKLIRYLLSHHLITLRSRLSVSNLFRKKKKLPPEQETTEEALGE
ncbi:MAG: tetratricopeptide repeat protein [Chitinophagaceae bacterium]|nr:tetratricopeptide repeat protein [Chitinophagaceae bacterium]